MGSEIRIVFDGAPEPEGGRFVAVKDEAGNSITAGVWEPLGNGYWHLRIPLGQTQTDARLLRECKEAAGRTLLMVGELSAKANAAFEAATTAMLKSKDAMAASSVD